MPKFYCKFNALIIKNIDHEKTKSIYASIYNLNTNINDILW